jgi:hypothetical protein
MNASVWIGHLVMDKTRAVTSTQIAQPHARDLASQVERVDFVHHRVWLVGVFVLYLALLIVLWWVLGKGGETLNFTTAYFLLANFVVVWWYAWLTRGLLQESRTLAQITANQFKLAQTRASNEQKLRWSDNKPLVATVANGGRLWIRNVGGGPALNVFYLASDPGAEPIGLGSLGVGQERQLPHGLSEPTDNWRHILVAEGLSSRTRRWNPMLNVGIGTALTAHEVGPLHEGVRMRDDEHWTLETFLEKNGTRLRARLSAIRFPAATE